MTVRTSAQAARLLRAGQRLITHDLSIGIGDFRIYIRSNSEAVVQRLTRYFAHFQAAGRSADVTVEAYDCPPLELDIEWRDWPREPGKTGRKDAFFELDDGRLLRKMRTGMLFLQSFDHRIAAGPCIACQSQVINFVNSQYMNWLQQRGWLICHAAGVAKSDVGLAIAGRSSGGKSTLMLALMGDSALDYVTNDRLFVRRNEAGVMAMGIPKMPRVNPGTVVHNPLLHPLIDPYRRQRLLAMPTAALWQLEEKHDVMIDDVFGSGRIRPSMNLTHVLVLNWTHDAIRRPELAEVALRSRSDLLAAIMKSPGPFYQHADGMMHRHSMQPSQQVWLDTLQGIRILEASGRIDFGWLTAELTRYLQRQ